MKYTCPCCEVVTQLVDDSSVGFICSTCRWESDDWEEEKGEYFSCIGPNGVHLLHYRCGWRLTYRPAKAQEIALILREKGTEWKRRHRV